MARPKKGITFWDRVYSQVTYEGECHIFNGNKDDCGYGRIHKDGGLIRIHRASWEKENGPIPEGMYICHKCNNRACLNPEHLYAGTQLDNMRDRKISGNYASMEGEKNNSAKIKAIDIPTIRMRIRNGDTCYSIARDYGVTGEAILHIKNHRTWKNF